jgi:hypothetical protein
MLFCQVAHMNSLREVCLGLAGCESPLKHLGIISAPKKSTLAYANANRPWELYETIFMRLLDKCQTETAAHSRRINLSNRARPKNGVDVRPKPVPGRRRVTGALVSPPMLQPLLGNLLEGVLRGDHDSGLFGFAHGHRIDAVGQPLPGCVTVFAGLGQSDFGIAPQRHQLFRTFEAVLPAPELTA